jgi:hypothetical protein
MAHGFPCAQFFSAASLLPLFVLFYFVVLKARRRGRQNINRAPVKWHSPIALLNANETSNLKSIYLSVRFFLTAVAVFRKPNAIPLCFSIDLVLNFLLSWLLVILPSMTDRGTLTGYGGYRGNKIPGVDKN